MRGDLLNYLYCIVSSELNHTEALATLLEIYLLGKHQGVLKLFFSRKIRLFVQYINAK